MINLSKFLSVNKDDIVIDIETGGTGNDCVIVSIGALIFNRSSEPGVFKDEFSVKLDVNNQPGRTVDIDTMLWWARDDMKEARQAAFSKNEPRVRLGLALKQLDDFIKKHNIDQSWACGPSFDNIKLETAYRQHKQEFPIPFYRWSCIRTLENFLFGSNTRKKGKMCWLEGTAHDALDDCKMEALMVQKSYLALKTAFTPDMVEKINNIISPKPAL